jgi:hypothetical protein
MAYAFSISSLVYKMWHSRLIYMSRVTILPNINTFCHMVSKELHSQSVTDGQTDTITMSLYVIFNIGPGISSWPITAFKLRSLAWYGSLMLIPGMIWKMHMPCNNLLLLYTWQEYDTFCICNKGESERPCMTDCVHIL